MIVCNDHRDNLSVAMLPEKVRLLLGKRVRDLRLEQGLSGTDLARAMGKSRGFVSDLERGCLNVTLETLNLVAEALGHDECDLLTFPKRILEPRQQNHRHDVIDLSRDVDEEDLLAAKALLGRAKDLREKTEERQRRLRLHARR
jgi:transcriptional regulator with XRE-family HTH domain